jgi:hypothetical protein
MLRPVVSAAVFWANLATPVSEEEYAQVMLQRAVWHEPLSAEARDYYYLAKGRFLAGFLREGMTDAEVRETLGARPSSWVEEEDQEGERWAHHYSLLGLKVRSRVGVVAGDWPTVLVVEWSRPPRHDCPRRGRCAQPPRGRTA